MILAWVYNSTGSVLLAMANTVDVIIPLVPDEVVVAGVVDERAVGTVVVVHLAVYVVVALAVVAYYGRERLANGAVAGAAYVGDESMA